MQEKDKDLKHDENEGSSDSGTCDKVELLRKQVADLEDRLLRALAEAQNEQKRADKEKAEIVRYSITEFARDMLTVRDNLKFAINSGTDNHDALMGGIRLTLSEMDKVLGRYKVTEIVALDAKFDPHLHQAMMEIEDKEKEPGTIVQVMQDGFTIHERLLRPALVGVSKKLP
jgi:molecular chaperone GrpE